MILRGILIFAVALLVIGLVYRRAPINFLRAESGWYLAAAHSDAQTQERMQRDFFRSSYGGHYTPLAFLAEFRCAKIVGANGSVWRARQIVAVALVSAALFALAFAAGGVFELQRGPRLALGCAIAAGFAFQAAMLDFIGWPFMIMQLLCIGFGCLAGYALVRLSSSPEKSRWAWVAALAAYGSLHFQGLGMAFVVAVGAVLAAILFVSVRSNSPELRPHIRSVAIALATMLVLTAAHAWAMLFLLGDQHTAAASQQQLSSGLIKLLLGFVGQFSLAGVESFIPTAAVKPVGRTIAYTWPLGVLLIGSLLAAAAWLLRRACHNPEPQSLSRFALCTFSITAFLTLTALIGVREFQTTPLNDMGNQLAYYTWVPRYVIPLQFILIPAAIVGAAVLARKAPRAVVVLFSGLALSAVVAQREFQSTAHRYVAPESRISHSGAWELVVETVSACRAAGLAVPDLPLDVLTQEFSPASISSFEPVLKRSLNLAPTESILTIPWEQYRATRPPEYESIVPLQLLQRKLGVDRKEKR